MSTNRQDRHGGDRRRLDEVYVAAGVGLYLVFGTLWADRPSAAMVVLTVVVVTLAFGHWSDRTGTRRLLSGLRAGELTAMDAPSLQRRYARLCDRSDLDQRPRPWRRRT